MISDLSRLLAIEAAGGDLRYQSILRLKYSGVDYLILAEAIRSFFNDGNIETAIYFKFRCFDGLGFIWNQSVLLNSSVTGFVANEAVWLDCNEDRCCFGVVGYNSGYEACLDVWGLDFAADGLGLVFEVGASVVLPGDLLYANLASFRLGVLRNSAGVASYVLMYKNASNHLMVYSLVGSNLVKLFDVNDIVSLYFYFNKSESGLHYWALYRSGSTLYKVALRFWLDGANLKNSKGSAAVVDADYAGDSVHYFWPSVDSGDTVASGNSCEQVFYVQAASNGYNAKLTIKSSNNSDLNFKLSQKYVVRYAAAVPDGAGVLGLYNDVDYLVLDVWQGLELRAYFEVTAGVFLYYALNENLLSYLVPYLPNIENFGAEDAGYGCLRFGYFGGYFFERVFYEVGNYLVLVLPVFKDGEPSLIFFTIGDDEKNALAVVFDAGVVADFFRNERVFDAEAGGFIWGVYPGVWTAALEKSSSKNIEFKVQADKGSSRYVFGAYRENKFYIDRFNSFLATSDYAIDWNSPVVGFKNFNSGKTLTGEYFPNPLGSWKFFFSDADGTLTKYRISSIGSYMKGGGLGLLDYKERGKAVYTSVASLQYSGWVPIAFSAVGDNFMYFVFRENLRVVYVTEPNDRTKYSQSRGFSLGYNVAALVVVDKTLYILTVKFIYIGITRATGEIDRLYQIADVEGLLLLGANNDGVFLGATGARLRYLAAGSQRLEDLRSWNRFKSDIFYDKGFYHDSLGLLVVVTRARFYLFDGKNGMVSSVKVAPDWVDVVRSEEGALVLLRDGYYRVPFFGGVDYYEGFNWMSNVMSKDAYFVRANKVYFGFSLPSSVGLYIGNEVVLKAVWWTGERVESIEEAVIVQSGDIQSGYGSDMVLSLVWDLVFDYAEGFIFGLEVRPGVKQAGVGQYILNRASASVELGGAVV